MPEDTPPEKPVVVNYSSNSNKSKQPSDAEKPKIKQVTSGTVVERKKSLGSKFKETFAGDDAQSVGNYLLFDVIIPATKNLISDMVSQGIERLLFGTSAPRRGTLSSGRTSYSKMYSGSKLTSTGGRELSTRGRAMHDFKEIILETRVEAEEVIDALMELISDYGVATVSDLYACVGITSDFTDTKYGWESLSSASIRHVREGYLLDLPRVSVIN